MAYIEDDTVVGVGTGSTVNHFIDALARIKARIDGAVSSSEASSERLRAHGIPVLDVNGVTELPVYVDGADEATRLLQLIKGGGAALTREKIVAANAATFVCIADDSKLVDRLGAFPLPRARGQRRQGRRRQDQQVRGQGAQEGEDRAKRPLHGEDAHR